MWNEPSVVIIIVAKITMITLFIMLYFTNERPKSILLWTAAWIIYLLNSGIFIIFETAPCYTDIAPLFIGSLSAVNSYLLLSAVHVYDKIKVTLKWGILTFVTILWLIITHISGGSFLLASIPAALILFIIYSYTGYFFIAGYKNYGIERVIAGVLLVMWGIHMLFFPYFWPLHEFRLTGFLITSSLNIIISLFVIIAFLQDTRRKFIAEKIKAEEADRMKTSFLANMSHEIRTPLNAILGFTQLLSKPDISPEDKDIFIKNIKNSGERLLGLLDDILDLSKIEAGAVKVYIADVSVNKLIEDLAAVVSLSRRVIDKNLKLVVEKAFHDGDDVIRTDETRLFQILSNLLNNAVKFTEHGTISTGYELIESDYIKFYVKDTGIGISKESIQKIYTPFFQEGKLPAAGGTGLGLAIVKGLTESLGGTIEISSAVDKGTEVSFTIPYIRNGETKHIKSFTGSPDSYNITGKKILLVEDEPVNRRLMEKFIESTGAELISTESGNESVELCTKDGSIDLVLMDLTLPDIDGYTAMERIRKVRPELPIVAQSATSMSEHRERARDAGADDFIAKPIKREELYNSIWKQLFGREEN